MDFLIAMNIGNTGNLEELIDADGLPVDSRYKNYSLLNYALVHGKKDVAKTIIEKGCEVNKKSPDYPENTPLHLAVNLDSVEIVQLLLRNGASVKATNLKGETPLHLAAKLKNDTYIDLLFSSLNDVEITNCTDESGLSYLHIACMRNNTSFIEHLFKSNIKTISLNSLKLVDMHEHWPAYTPIHFAAEFDRINVIQLLLHYNANVNVKAKFGLTPLHLAIKRGNLKIVKILLKHSTNSIENVNAQIDLDSEDFPGYTALHFAVEFNSISILKLLLRYKPEINIKSKIGMTPLHIAVKKGRSNLVEVLLEHNADVNCIDLEKRSTPLHIAASQMQKKIISILLNKSADVNIQQIDGMTSLHIAASKSFTKSKPKKCTVFRSPFVFLHQHHCETHCETSFKKKNNEIIDLILSTQNIGNVNPVDHRGFTHFHIACMRRKLHVVERFLESGVNVNEKVHTDSLLWPGYTALHFAVENDRVEIVQLLLRHGADVKVVNANGMTPLHLANKSGQSQKEEIIEILLFALEDEILQLKDNGGMMNFHIACMKQCSESIENTLKSEADVNSVVQLTSVIYPGYTPLHFAVQFRRFRSVEILLERGADVNARDAQGLTPLHMACQNKDIDLVKILLEHDANANCTALQESEYCGRTPLHMSCCLFTPCWSIVQLLLDYGADINIEDSMGDNPLSCFYKIPCQNRSITNILNVLYIYRNFRKHVRKLKAINFFISEKTETYHQKLETWCKSDLTRISDEVGFSRSCEMEVELLKSVKIDKYSTLYNILYRDSNEMTTHIKNFTFQDILNSEDFEQRYPVYGYLLKLQFKKGMLRRNLLKPAKYVMDLAADLTLPDSCSERILRYLDNDDLNALIKARSSACEENRTENYEPSRKRLRIS